MKIVLIITIFVLKGCLYQLNYIDLKDESEDKWEEIGIDESNTKKKINKNKDR